MKKVLSWKVVSALLWAACFLLVSCGGEEQKGSTVSQAEKAIPAVSSTTTEKSPSSQTLSTAELMERFEKNVAGLRSGRQAVNIGKAREDYDEIHKRLHLMSDKQRRGVVQLKREFDKLTK